MGIGATQLACAVTSDIRAAGRLLISTVAEATWTTPGPAGMQDGSMQGAVISVKRAAG